MFRSPGRRRSEARLEAHRCHTDIHCVCAGVEEMGWKPRSRCRQPQGEYNAEKDVEFFVDEPYSYIAVHPGEFVIFFPEDAQRAVDRRRRGPQDHRQGAAVKTLVLGLGNPLVSDDSVGLRVAAKLKSRLADRPEIDVNEDYWAGCG